jgi:hypothetical protein
LYVFNVWVRHGKEWVRSDKDTNAPENKTLHLNGYMVMKTAGF